jgi:Glucosamine-6-phosphate isomerases/6-phosphogluconolactonase
MSSAPPQIPLPNDPAPRPTARKRHDRGGRTGTLVTPAPASLFPGTKALDERAAWVTSSIGVKPEPRISLTYPALQSSRVILFVVSGAKKRDILARVLANDMTLPAARLATRGTIHIFADRAAIGG